MKSDVVIEIFGKVDDAETVAQLAAAAAAEGTVDWGSGLDEGDAAENLIECAEAGRAFVLTRQDTGNFFEKVTQVCRTRSLSYVVSAGEAGAEGFDTIFAWKPGMETPFATGSNGTEAVVALSRIREALDEGIEAVRLMVEELERKTLVNVERRIEVSPAAAEEYLREAGCAAP